MPRWRNSTAYPTAAFGLLLAIVSASAQRTVAEQYLALSINQERLARGLPPLAWNQQLAFAAHRHAERMETNNKMSHRLPGEPDLSERVAATGIDFPVLAENVSVGPSPAEIHHALMESAHHRENIMNPKVNAMGVAVIFARGSLWVVEDFALDLPKTSLEDQERQVAGLVQATGLLEVISTSEARSMCGMTRGFVGAQPTFTIRYTADSLARLPDALLARLSQGRVAWASVGACGPSRSGLYDVAVVLYR